MDGQGDANIARLQCAGSRRGRTGPPRCGRILGRRVAVATVRPIRAPLDAGASPGPPPADGFGSVGLGYHVPALVPQRTGSRHAASTGQSRPQPWKPYRRARRGEPREASSQARPAVRVRGPPRDPPGREPMAPDPRLAGARRPVREGPGEEAHADHHPAPHPCPFRRRLPRRGGKRRGDAIRDPRGRLRHVRLPPPGPRPGGVRGRPGRHHRLEEGTPRARGHGVPRLPAARLLRLREGRSRGEAPRRGVRFGKGVLFQLDGGHLLPHRGCRPGQPGPSGGDRGPGLGGRIRLPDRGRLRAPGRPGAVRRHDGVRGETGRAHDLALRPGRGRRRAEPSRALGSGPQRVARGAPPEIPGGAKRRPSPRPHYLVPPPAEGRASPTRGNETT